MSDTLPPVLPLPPDEANPFPRRAAMFSLAAPFVGIAINLVVNIVARGHRLALFLGGLAAVTLILAGFVLGIIALVSNRRRKLPAVTPRAVGGIGISGFLILLMLAGLPGLLRAIEKAKERQRPQTNVVERLER